MIEIASFQQVEEAELLAGLLKSEGIACYIRNEVSSRVLRGCVAARVEILENDVPRALEVIRDSGFFHPEEDTDETAKESTGFIRYIPVVRDLSFGKQIIVLLVVTGGMLAILIYLNSFLSGNNI